MRWLTIFALATVCFGQGDSTAQQPNYQPGWPCTGKERAFDPVYLKTSEATGGYLFLFDKSEASGFSLLIGGDLRHKATIARATGETDSYVDIPFHVDSSVESLFVVASLQCMQTIYLYDPNRAGAEGRLAGGSDEMFHAGRIATIPAPQPGAWVLRLLGKGSYVVAIAARTPARLGEVVREGDRLTVWLDEAIRNPVFRLVNAAGEPIQSVALERDPAHPGRYAGAFSVPSVPFRVQAEWSGADQQEIWRTDPRLLDPTPSISGAKPASAQPTPVQ